MLSDMMKLAEKGRLSERKIDYKPGDTISVSMKIKEGDKERVQQFQGVVIQQKGSGMSQSVTVRKASGNVYVERVFPIHSPLISEISVVREGAVRRARLYYLRERTGKSTRIKEK
jgi:large subunit ribosomal protein L19